MEKKKEEKKRNDNINNVEKKLHSKQKVCYLCKKVFSTDDDHKKYHKVRDYCH